MKKYPLILLIFTTFLGILACREDIPNNSFEKRNDRAYRLLEKSKATEDIEQKLNLLSSALEEIPTSRDTLSAIIYDNLIYYYNLNKILDSSIYYSNLLINYGIETKDTLQIAKGYYRKASAFNFKNDQVNVLRNTFEAQKHYLLAGDSINAGQRGLELSIAQTRLGDFPGSQNSAVWALSLLENSSDSLYMASIYNNLAVTYRKMNDLDESIREYNNALKYVGTQADSLTVMNNLANIYAEKEEYDTSLDLLSSIIPLAEKTNALNRFKDNYYYTLWLRNKADVADSLISIMEARNRDHDLTGLLASYDHLVRIYEEDDPEKALHYANRYYETARKLHSVSDEVSALYYLVNLSPPRASKTYALTYIRLNDSILSARDQVKNLFAKINYDEERKLAEIDLLEKTTFQQQLEVLRGRNRLNIAILLGILLLGSVAVIYYYLKQRHKKERIREIHATEARISKKIHDELANDVYNVMTELERPANLNKDVTLNKLESIYLRTRNISRENTPLPTGSNYQEDLHDMLSQSVPAHVNLYLSGFNEISWSKVSRESKIVVYRVLQELMVNMKKHSDASIVSLNFNENSSKLKITYNDNGSGFSSAELKKGAGLKNVENRIETIGGSFNFHPEKNTGFSAEILIPF
ncbi:hypothetical protein GCM10007103_31050 [Salinimicrobium marinum]|uniref:histidine kinase n=1 Tax=Salinimicrobium marinum TaxID=680283 RepID=A0A918SJ51_9FLAO|nr:tetratricopeptide repeat-containing sensor histidine kinase [Salinimicrobium marinum]GHA47907.1 hypothetical protein GCM10007103_31050 [Salinimicrobium marinum]